jgi:hypothetical protein
MSSTCAAPARRRKPESCMLRRPRGPPPLHSPWRHESPSSSGASPSSSRRSTSSAPVARSLHLVRLRPLRHPRRPDRHRLRRSRLRPGRRLLPGRRRGRSQRRHPPRRRKASTGAARSPWRT